MSTEHATVATVATLAAPPSPPSSVVRPSWSSIRRRPSSSSVVVRRRRLLRLEKRRPSTCVDTLWLGEAEMGDGRWGVDGRALWIRSDRFV